MNQDWALAQWRADAAKNDPPFYTVRLLHGGRPFVWLNVAGNVGWYAPEIDATGKMVGIRAEAAPQPHADETEETRRMLNWQFKLISPKQRQKLEFLLSNT